LALSFKNIKAVPVVRGECGQNRVHRQGEVGLCELKEKVLAVTLEVTQKTANTEKTENIRM
jgi:hypothetical protein